MNWQNFCEAENELIDIKRLFNFLIIDYDFSEIKKLISEQKPQVDNSYNEIVKGSGFILASILLARIFEYASRAFVARFLGASDYGNIYLGLNVIYLLTSFSLLGIHIGVTRFIAYYKALSDIKSIESTFTSGLKIVFLTSLLYSALLFFFRYYIANNIFNKPDLEVFFSYLSLILPFSVLVSFFNSVLRGFKKSKYVALSQSIFQRGLVLLFLIIFLIFQLNTLGAVFAYFLGFIFTALISFYFLNYKTYSFFSKKVIFHSSFNKEILVYSWPLVLTFLLIEAETRCGVLILGYFRSSAEVGYYTVVLPLAYLLPVSLNIITFMLMPVASELFSQNKIEKMKLIYKTFNKWVFVLSSITFFLLFFFSEPIITLLFGSEFKTAGDVLKVLSVALYIFASLGCAGSLLLSIGKTKCLLVSDIIGLIINIGFGVFYIPRIGIMGAAIALLLSMLAVNIIRLLYVINYLNEHPFTLSYLKIFLSSLLWSAVCYYIFIGPLDGKLFLLIPVLLIVVILSLISYIFMKGFDYSDLEIIQYIEVKIGIKFTFIRKFISI